MKKVKEKHKTNKNQKGITLIALVVTIIILLILAGITITTLFGEGGILRTAQGAKQEVKKGEDLDQIGLGMLESQINKILSTEKSDLIEAIENLGMEIKGIEKIIFDRETEVGQTYIIAEKDGNYYRVVANNGDILPQVEPVDQLTEEAVVLYKFSMGEIQPEPDDNSLVVYNGVTYCLVTEQNENLTIVYFKKYNPPTIKIKVNSGEDGFVLIPVSVYQVTSVDWGDGTTTTADETEKDILKSTRLASRNNIKLATFSNEPTPHHLYKEKNKEFEISISGNIDRIHTGFTSYYNEDHELEFYDDAPPKILEIVDWGSASLDYLCLKGCINLVNIASPGKNTFKNADSFYESFRDCTSLTKIPTDLFAYCDSMTYLVCAFYNCTSLTGIAPNVWERFDAPGTDCFYNCTGLSNYDDIPESWK